jgi:hypothetical protein
LDIIRLVVVHVVMPWLALSFADSLILLHTYSAQKSGTTAFMGFLITHPNFTPPVGKVEYVLLFPCEHNLSQE